MIEDPQNNVSVLCKNTASIQPRNNTPNYPRHLFREISVSSNEASCNKLRRFAECREKLAITGTLLHKKYFMSTSWQNHPQFQLLQYDVTKHGMRYVYLLESQEIFEHQQNLPIPNCELSDSIKQEWNSDWKGRVYLDLISAGMLSMLLALK